MSNRTSHLITARWLLPILSPPIEHGWVRVAEGRIVEIGSGPPPATARDLGDVALLPGLVNAHTHLEFSDFNEPIGIPGVPLCQWIGMVISARGQTSAEQKRMAIENGIREMRRTGTILAGEITTPPSCYPDIGLMLIPFAEVVGLDPNRGAERLELARALVESDPTAAISPHAPYSTPWTLIRSCVELARAQDRPLAMHVAESPDERELLLHGSGPFADSLRSIGVWQEGLFPWGPQPVTELIRMLGRAPRGLIVHGNDLQVDEMDALAGYPNLTVVYCPRTHDFFRYPPHPVGQLLAVGVRVALGTDSRASNPDLSVWGEVQFLLKHRSDLDPHAILTMATVNGAQALGRPELGGLCEGNVAKFGVVASRAPSVDCLYGDLAENEYEPIQC